MQVLFKIIGIALLTTISALMLKQKKPEISILIVLAGGALTFFYIIDLIENVLGLFDYIMEITHLDSKLFALLVKIVGIGYLTEFSANMCEDAGSVSMASKIMLAGKLVIFVMSIPIIKTLLEIIVGLMP